MYIILPMDFVKPIIGNKHKFDMNFIQYFLKFDLAFNFSKNEKPSFGQADLN